VTRPIIVGYDPATADHAPVEFGLAVSRLTGARLVVASVQAGPPVLAVGTPTPGVAAVVQAPDPDLVADCTEALDALAGELASQGAVECRRLQGTSAARALHEAAEAEDAVLLVVGSGSTAARLLPGAPCPVAVVPRAANARGAIATVGVACNDSEEAREALRGAHALARAAGATLRVITVVEPGLSLYARTEPRTAERPGKDATAVEGEARVEAEERLRAAVAELGDDVPASVEAFIGDPAEVLIERSEELDLLVCGSRGYGPLRAVMLGSVTRRVASEARCPVIVLARGVKSPLKALFAESERAASPT
jgi:nucleotide-binding universal stress UspA family protein